ncbi:MAG: hypothetical protein HOP17_15255 [Acidobacteria bacterium]|nr:hypothetical protein [Acidobacteriota bacterium]
MISDDEIKQKAIELEVSTSNVQRDYVFGWLLSGIFHISPTLSSSLILKGGNAFRKAYFADARYSGDLDFSVQAEIDPTLIHNELNQVCQYVNDNTGVTFAIDENRVQPKRVDKEIRAFEARLYFRSFFGDEHVDLKAKLDVTEFDRIFLPIQQREILHDYSDAEACVGNVACHQLEELLASKLLALIQRVHSPDLYDFIYSVFFQNALPVNRLQVLQTFLRKTIYEGSPGVARDLLLGIPFNTFKNFWEKYLVRPRASLISFDTAEEQFRNIIESLFGLLSGESRGTAGGIFRPGYLSHYSSEQRNLIMEAGRTQTLLQIHYDGLSRLVEPYSLVYKVRKDGVGREYFYGYCIQGGRSGGEGIRTYTQDKMNSIQLTDQKFEARFPIELTKSESQSGPEYFGRLFGR